MVLDLTGKKLGDYIIEAQIAVGGMATIYRALDENLGRVAAIKVLMPDVSDRDDTLMMRFEREARAIAQLEHENIIPIYQFGQAEGLYFLAMRFIEGDDLAELVTGYNNQGSLMPLERALPILEQVAAALDYAHSKGIVHRDVKPSNVLIAGDDKAYLSDFGLVLNQTGDQTLGTAFGTPRYISPEQATDSTMATAQSDIYSLAVIVYEIVTGQRLFRGKTPMEIALSHITEAPQPPRTFNPNISTEMQAVILRSLAKDPSARHESAREFINELRETWKYEQFLNKADSTEDAPPTGSRTLPLKTDTPSAAPPPPTPSPLPTPIALPVPPGTSTQSATLTPMPRAPYTPEATPIAVLLESEQPAKPWFERRGTRRVLGCLSILVLIGLIAGAFLVIVWAPSNARITLTPLSVALDASTTATRTPQVATAMASATNSPVIAPAVFTATLQSTDTAPSTLTRTPRSTNTPEPTPRATTTSVPTNTPTPTLNPTTAVPTPTELLVVSTVPTTEADPINSQTPTATNTPRPTNTSIPTFTNTPRPTNTSTPTVTQTPRPTNTSTATMTQTQRPTNTSTATITNTPRPTNTPTATITRTPRPTNTATPTPRPTNTPTPTQTPVPLTGALRLRYTSDVLAILNTSENDQAIESLVLRGTTPDDMFSNEATTLGTTLAGESCVVLLAGGTNALVPSVWGCDGARQIILNTPLLFWRADNAEDQTFSLTLGDTELLCNTVGRAVARLNEGSCRTISP